MAALAVATVGAARLPMGKPIHVPAPARAETEKTV
jgi:hypothetical protein